MCAVVTVVFGVRNVVETIIVICSYDLFKSSIKPSTNPNPIYRHLSRDNTLKYFLKCMRAHRHENAWAHGVSNIVHRRYII
jgi:hypothetical protein